MSDTSEEDAINSTPSPIVDSASLEKYIETEISLASEIKSNNELYVTALLNENKNIDLYTISQENTDDSSFVWAYTLKNLKWERNAVAWLNGLESQVGQRRINVLLGADGEYYAYYVDSTELSHLVKKVDNGFVEIPTPDWDKTKDRNYRMIPDQVAVLENGNIVMASRQKNCYVYDKNNGEVLNTFPCGWYTSLYTLGNHVVILDRENKSFLVYDTVQGKLVNKIKGNFNGRALLCKDGDEIYACYNEGIYGAKMESEGWNKVLGPGLYKFANDSETLLKVFIINHEYYVLYGESGVRLMKYTKGDKQTSAAHKKLNIYSLEDNESVRIAITEFQLKHPEINVVFEVGETSKGAATVADSIRALNAKILAGDGPDILVLDGLPEDSYIRKGI
jgi:hypothetical protein